MKYLCHILSKRDILPGLNNDDIEFVIVTEDTIFAENEFWRRSQIVIIDSSYIFSRKKALRDILEKRAKDEIRPVLLGLVDSSSELNEIEDLPLDGILSMAEIKSTFFRKRLEVYTSLVTYRETVSNLKRMNEDLLLTLVNVLDLRVPGLKERVDLSVEVLEYLSKAFELEANEKDELTLAVALREIGKIALKEPLLKHHKHEFLSETLREFRTHAMIGRELLSKVESMKPISDLVGKQYERFDGEGFPSGLRGNEMSISALILQGITFAMELYEMGVCMEEIASRVRSESFKALDPYVASHLARYFEDRELRLNGSTVLISTDELKPGMIIAQDLYSLSGNKILPKGSAITEHILEIIEKRRSVDPVIGCVRIYAKRV